MLNEKFEKTKCIVDAEKIKIFIDLLCKINKISTQTLQDLKIISDFVCGIGKDYSYDKSKILGEGGFAEVYQGKDLNSNQFVAIKKIKDKLSINEFFKLLNEPI